MSFRQRITVFIGLVIVALMFLFPPMIKTNYGNSRGCQSAGYGFLFSARSTYIAALDKHNEYEYGWCSWQINQQTLAYQIIIVTVLIIAVVTLLGHQRKTT
jgi:hypothetical protein